MAFVVGFQMYQLLLEIEDLEKKALALPEQERYLLPRPSVH